MFYTECYINKSLGFTSNTYINYYLLDFKSKLTTKYRFDTCFEMNEIQTSKKCLIIVILINLWYKLNDDMHTVHPMFFFGLNNT